MNYTVAANFNYQLSDGKKEKDRRHKKIELGQLVKREHTNRTIHKMIMKIQFDAILYCKRENLKGLLSYFRH